MLLGQSMVRKRVRARVRAAMQQPETGPAIRRYFVNTIFDSTFVMLGIIIGSAFSNRPDMHLVVVTVLTSAVALGISTGVSVYEAETMEQRRRLDEIEKAMLRSLDDTHIERASRASVVVIAFINFLAPLISGAVILSAFLIFSPSDLVAAAWTAIVLAIAMLFVTGFVLGRTTDRNPLLQGARMAIIGVVAFAVCYYIQTIV